MFQRLYELSQCLPERAAWERLNEGMPTNCDRGLALCFGPGGEWRGVKTYLGNQGVIYRSGPSNGTDFTPCCKLAKDTANRLSKAIKSLIDCPNLPNTKRQWLANSLTYFTNEQEAIWAEVEVKRKEAGIDDKNHWGYIYWADETMSPVYAWLETREFMASEVLESYAKKSGVRQQGCCAVCGQTGGAFRHEVIGLRQAVTAELREHIGVCGDVIQRAQVTAVIQ